MSDTVLLTGITGFLGGHVALELLNSGYTLRGSLRNPQRADATRQALEAAGADTSRLDFVTLDLTADDGWANAAEGVRYVIHSASPFVTTMPKDPQELIGPAVAGTERAFTAARNARVDRIVLTSSTVAIVAGRRGASRLDQLGPDDWANPEDGRLNAYATSKVLAERKAWEMAYDGGPELAVINPGFISGPLLDNDPGTSGAVIRRILTGDFPMLPKLYIHQIDVRDLARIHVAAMKDPSAAGKRHLTAFDTLLLKQAAQVLVQAFPDRAGSIPTRQAPDWLLRILSLFDGDVRATMNELGYNPYLDASRARRLLCRAPITGAQSVTDMARSLIERGLA
ncbi:NAD-dependent epimerase/dehydratase family protein [Pseudoruegeria sp. HB172150]|uniref:NAD-dependent epimerase/dehydratase family protein n=1 Tax=Pseudoruegeria sp. HB172150 TaxID=2721164 RepID=UPI0015571F55|nr:NAD-dependent epimerase/dehydratase family protein [Pseudoruegeria sp. HB172150]